jgi:predicted transcriptional regulator
MNIYSISNRGRQIVKNMGGRLPSDKQIGIKILYDLYRFKSSTVEQIALRIGEPEGRTSSQLSFLRQKGLVQSLM